MVGVNLKGHLEFKRSLNFSIKSSKVLRNWNPFKCSEKIGVSNHATERSLEHKIKLTQREMGAPILEMFYKIVWKAYLCLLSVASYWYKILSIWIYSYTSTYTHYKHTHTHIYICHRHIFVDNVPIIILFHMH